MWIWSREPCWQTDLSVHIWLIAVKATWFGNIFLQEAAPR